MGEPRANATLDSLIARLDEQPETMADDKLSTWLDFPESGLSVGFMKITDCFVYAFTARKRLGDTVSVGTHTDDLPVGVHWGDGPLDVKKSLGLDSVSSKASNIDDPGWEEVFDVTDDVRLTMMFKGNLTDGRLSRVGFMHIPSDDHVNKALASAKTELEARVDNTYKLLSIFFNKNGGF